MIFGFTYLLAAVVFALVALVATKERMASPKATQPGMLPVLGISDHAMRPTAATA